MLNKSYFRAIDDAFENNIVVYDGEAGGELTTRLFALMKCTTKYYEDIDSKIDLFIVDAEDLEMLNYALADKFSNPLEVKTIFGVNVDPVHPKQMKKIKEYYENKDGHFPRGKIKICLARCCNGKFILGAY